MKAFSLTLCALLLASSVTAQRNGGLKRRVTKRVNCGDIEKAADGDIVSVSYVGRLSSNKKEFDKSQPGKPLEFELGKGLVIPGWEQGLRGTCPGEGLELTIPPHLAYGEEGAGNGIIPPNAELLFTLILEGLKKDLSIEVLEEGNCQGGKKRVRQNDKITLHYDAKLADGTVFDSSYERNEPLVMTVGKAGIAGWDDGVKGACQGEKRRVIVPSHLGYVDGIEGLVPKGATIVLEMEIIKVGDRVLSFLDQISSGNFGRG